MIEGKNPRSRSYWPPSALFWRVAAVAGTVELIILVAAWSDSHRIVRIGAFSVANIVIFFNLYQWLKLRQSREAAALKDMKGIRTGRPTAREVVTDKERIHHRYAELGTSIITIAGFFIFIALLAIDVYQTQASQPSIDYILNARSLRDKNLSGRDLSAIQLPGKDLRGASLRGSDLREANLEGANLRGADLRDADLGRSNLRGVDLRDANLTRTNFGGADLRGANLRDAKINQTSFLNATFDSGTIFPEDFDPRESQLREAP